MKSKVFTIYDSKMEAYMNPFLMATKGQALRAFTDNVNDPQSQLNRHPEDFTLFEIGEYDDHTGEYIMAKVKTALGVALEFKKDDKPSQVRAV